jgi:hypothetical protein
MSWEQPTPEEHAQFQRDAKAREVRDPWILAFTGGCEHTTAVRYPDGLMECNRCGLTPYPAPDSEES